MNHERVRAGYAVAVGVAMVGLWAVLFATGGVPELATTAAVLDAVGHRERPSSIAGRGGDPVA